MNSRLIVIAEELMRRIHNVKFIGDERILHQVQGGEDGINRRAGRNPGFDAVRCQQ